MDVKGRSYELVAIWVRKTILPCKGPALQVMHLTLARILQAFELKTQSGVGVDLEECSRILAIYVESSSSSSSTAPSPSELSIEKGFEWGLGLIPSGIGMLSSLSSCTPTEHCESRLLASGAYRTRLVTRFLRSQGCQGLPLLTPLSASAVIAR
ncbi:hypothetical protein Syun_031814 [Stephania yunnanensis]|uniref:Uncharacterized protein n=1 Tax=Stephania yunnanensis TaxID=152371 RepID=A0AAP0DYN3_9MAGN